MALCGLLGLAAAATVYGLALNRPSRPKSYTATAIVRQPLGGFNGTDGGVIARPLRSNLAQAEAQVVSDVALRGALQRLTTRCGSSETIGEIRQKVQVSATASSVDDRLEISIGYTGGDPDYAIGLVNGLAEHYADDYCTQLQEVAERSHRQAREAARLAQQELLAAKEALRSFLAAHFEEHQAEAKRLGAPPVKKAGAEPATSGSDPGSRMIDNPEWLRLERQRQGLVARRAELLIDRTPAHPEVNDVQLRITQLEQLLADVPRQIAPAEGQSAALARPLVDEPLVEPSPTSPSGKGPSAVASQESPFKTAPEHADDARKYLALKQALDWAQRESERLDAVERHAWQRRIEIPYLEVAAAEQCEISEPTGRPGRLLLVALISGLALATGAGMISTGVEGDRPLTTVAQARQAVGVPVIAEVPALSSRTVPSDAGRCCRTTGTATAVCGIVLIVACIGVLVVYMPYLY